MRLINVSNRLPVSITNMDGKYNITRSIGGVATGLSSFLKHYKTENKEVLWLGWPGISLKDDGMLKKLLSEQDCHPVHLSQNLMDNFYYGFCNQTLWPLFHCMPSLAHYQEDHWVAYQQVNAEFFDAISSIIQPGDVVWIHDYHFLLLPRMIKEKFPLINVGFFLHISFPSFELMQFLPKKCRERILHGMLGANLIGFHTHEYSQNFMRSVRRMIGYEQSLGFIKTPNNITKVDVYPMGIDIQGIQNSLNLTNVMIEQEKILSGAKNLKIILSADRLDYTKGIINKLHAFKLFLETNSEWHQRIVLQLVVAPSRNEIKNYSQVKKEIDELVGEINGRFGETEWAPIHYQYKSFSMEQMVAFYSIADIALITPIRDGMNLIAKEYVAAKKDGNGVLILSETAGSSKELTGALIVNPNDELEIVYTIKQALEMPVHEQRKRMLTMQTMLEKYNLSSWGAKFIKDLNSMKASHGSISHKILDRAKFGLIKQAFSIAKRRLIALDYDGTLVPLTESPAMAQPGSSILKLIDSLASDDKNHVAIVSGRDKNTLEKWFSHSNITLVAEHSGWIKQKCWEKSATVYKSWKQPICSILEIFTDRLIGSFIEEKDFSVVWHYRNTDEKHGEELARELLDYLITYTDKSDLKVVQGKKIVEIKAAYIGKDYAINKILSSYDYDFILAAGDDASDEDMFLALPDNAYSIKVGLENSSAKFHVGKCHDMVNFLELLN